MGAGHEHGGADRRPFIRNLKMIVCIRTNEAQGRLSGGVARINLWRCLKELLEVGVRTNVDIREEKDSKVEVEFLVSNTEPPLDIEYPDIIFDDVTLKISTNSESPELFDEGLGQDTRRTGVEITR